MQTKQLNNHPDPSTWVLRKGWDLIDQTFEHRKVGEVTLGLCGCAAQHKTSGRIATGSAACWQRDPKARAAYELMERMAIIEATEKGPQQRWRCLENTTQKTFGLLSGSELFKTSDKPDEWRFALSNGIALGVDREQASAHAIKELIERHLVLGSWLGASKPQVQTCVWPQGLRSLSQRFKLEVYSFGSYRVDGTPITAMGAFLWPKDEGDLLVYGFAADSTADNAMERALSEAVQRLAFLDGEPLSGELPEFSPSPDYHQDYYLAAGPRAKLRDWLSGSFFKPERVSNLQLEGAALLVDLTPEGMDQHVVIKAILPGTLELWFGRKAVNWAPDAELHPIV